MGLCSVSRRQLSAEPPPHRNVHNVPNVHRAWGPPIPGPPGASTRPPQGLPPQGLHKASRDAHNVHRTLGWEPPGSMDIADIVDIAGLLVIGPYGQGARLYGHCGHCGHCRVFSYGPLWTEARLYGHCGHWEEEERGRKRKISTLREVVRKTNTWKGDTKKINVFLRGRERGRLFYVILSFNSKSNIFIDGGN